MRETLAIASRGLAAVTIAGALLAPSAARAQLAPAGAGAADSLAASAPETLVPIWTLLGDTVLAALEGEALRASPDLHGARARLRVAGAERRLSTFDFAPTITASSAYTRQRLSSTQLPGVPAPLREGDIFDAGLDATWELDVFGRVRRTVAARSAVEASSEADVRATQVSVTAEVARAYYELQGTQRELEVARRNAANQRRTLQLTIDRLSAGRGTGFDRERASAQLDRTLAAIPALEAQRADDAARLAALLGRPSGEGLEDLATATTLPSLPEPPAADAMAAYVRVRPDIRSAERRLDAQRALVGAARADYLPRIGVFGSVGLNASAVDALGRTDASRYVVGPVISWAAFDLGRVRTRVEAEQARAEAARADFDRAVTRANTEAHAAAVGFERARARLESLREAAAASERGAELARLRFAEGAADFFEVLDAERTLLEVQDSLVRGETDAITAFISLYAALGGAWGR